MGAHEVKAAATKLLQHTSDDDIPPHDLHFPHSLLLGRQTPRADSLLPYLSTADTQWNPASL